MHPLAAIALFAFLGSFCGQGWARWLAPTSNNRRLVGALAGALCTFLLMVLAGVSLAVPLPYIASAVALPFGYLMTR